MYILISVQFNQKIVNIISQMKLYFNKISYFHTASNKTINQIQIGEQM